MSIHRKLFLLLSSVLVLPIIGLVVLLGPWIDRAFRDQAASVTGQLTTQAAGYLELYFTGLEEVPALLLENEAIHGSLTSPPYEEFYDIVSRSWAVMGAVRSFVGRRTDIEQIDLYGRNGFGVAGYRPVAGGYARHFADPAPRAGRVGIDLSRWSYLSSSNSLVLRQWLRDERNEPIGGAVVHVPAHRIENILEGFRIGSRSFITLVSWDEAGTIQLVRDRFHGDERPIADEAIEEVRRRGIAAPARRLGQIEVDFRAAGDRYLAFLAPLRPDQIGLMIVVAIDELLTPLRHIRVVVLIVLVVGALVAFSAVAGLSRRLISTPIERLATAMDRFSGSDTETQVEVETTDEIGYLAGRYNAMLTRLNTLLDRVKHEEEQRRRAEWAALQAQINPHFLYNTLNSISWLARSHGVAEISDMSSSLGRLFKYAFEDDGGWVAVEREIEYIRSYLNIQRYRYGDRLMASIECSGECRTRRIPKFILQPIVENAVQHAVEPSVRPVTVRVDCEPEGTDGVSIVVSDGGRELSDAQLARLKTVSSPSNGHIGLAYVRDRLSNVSRGVGHLEVGRAPEGGLFVRMVVRADGEA